MHRSRRSRFLTTPALVCVGLLGCSPRPLRSDRAADARRCPEALPLGMACIPGGAFIIGSNAKDWGRENPELSAFAEHRVTLSTFFLDKYEVTTKEYQACAASGRCEATRSNYPHMRGARQPQLKANWYQAQAFCQALGKRLPTEAEFEAASRGPAGEIYPWGNAPPTCEMAIIKDAGGRGCARLRGPGRHDTPARFASTGNTWDVGSRPAGRYGLHDMAGNAQEWVSDWFAPSLALCRGGCEGRDPKGPCRGAESCPGFAQKLVKGGAWYWGPISARAAARRPYRPENRPPHHFGFRCAKDVD